MELENIIISEVHQAQKTKSYILPHMQSVDLIQIQQFYEEQVTLREVTYKKKRQKKEVKKVNMVDVLSIQA
jgi:hypothetical protein